MRNADYIYAVASIRVKEKSLLTDSDVQTMTGMKSEREVLSYLKERGWGDGGSSDSMEEVLAAEEEKQLELLKRLGVEQEILDVLAMQELYHNIKTAIKATITNRDDEEAFYPIENYGKKEMMDILRDKEYTKLPEHMQKVAEETFELMLTTGDGQRCDMILDRACLDAIEAIAAHTKNKFLSEYAELKVVVTDIRIAVRAALTRRSKGVIEEALAPNRTLDVSTLAQAAATNIDAVYEYLEKAGFKDAVEALKISFSEFERYFDDYIIKMISGQKTNIESSGPVVAYYLAKQNEIRTARIIMTAKANGFDEESISKRVRRMYG